MASGEYDVLIAGGGPAGAATAARLARLRGSEGILVLDRYHFPRDKPCGGALTGHVDPVLAELGLSVRVPRVACPDAAVVFGSFERRVQMGKSVDVIRRQELDADLLAQVRELGVEVVEGEGVEVVTTDSHGVRVTTSAGRELRAKVLVGADGAASVVRKWLLDGAKETPHRLFVTELTAAVPPGFERTMIYDFSLMTRGLRGYLWIFPSPPDRANVGLMHYPSKRQNLGGRQLTELLREGLAAHGIELPARGVRGWPVWGYHPSASISAERVVTVGDAAGIDGLTGEGIAVAMEQAVIAGDAIHEALVSGSFAFADYRQRIRRAVVGRELALDRWLARLLYDTRAWQDWLSLVLLDDEVLEMYSRRVDGTEVLADQKLRLYRALGRHVLQRGRRRRLLDRYARPFSP